MHKKLPKRIYYSLPEIEKIWNISSAEIQQWLIFGDLNAHVWLPVTSVYQALQETTGDRIVSVETLCHKEGYLKLCNHDYRTLYQDKHAYIRCFLDENPTIKYKIPDHAAGHFTQLSNLVILEKERLRFEQDHHILPSPVNSGLQQRSIEDTNANQPTFILDPQFKKIRYKGTLHHFGSIQASILRLLYDAACKSEPWQNGKLLLAEVGSRSMQVANVFTRKPMWENFITSDQRGLYRINEEFLCELGKS